MHNSLHVETGRRLVADGGLVQLRKELGFTRTAMSEMLCIAPLTYTRWESQPGTSSRMWEESAARLGRFAIVANRTLLELTEHGIQLKDMLPLHLVAMELGMPQELILQWYRDSRIHATDLGILGLWIQKTDLHTLREAV